MGITFEEFKSKHIDRSKLRMCMRCKAIKHKCTCEKKEPTEVEKLRDEVRELEWETEDLKGRVSKIEMQVQPYDYGYR